MSSEKFLDKLLDLSAEQAGGVGVEWLPLGDVSYYYEGYSEFKTEEL